jgi:hypothetical protein
MEKLAKDALKVNNNAENEKLVLDLVQLLLDIGGIIEPTPFADLTSYVISIARGETFDALISVISILPYAGDTAKLAKFGKYLDTLATLAKRVANNPQLARTVEPILETIVRTLDDAIALVPKELVVQLQKLRDAAYNALKKARESLGNSFTTENAVRVATSLGKHIEDFRIHRIIGKGETVKELLEEFKRLTFMYGEAAIVRLADGRRAIVLGGEEGINFGTGNVTRIYAHSHPYHLPRTGPSGDDFDALKSLDEEFSYLFEHGDLFRFERSGAVVEVTGKIP